MAGGFNLNTRQKFIVGTSLVKGAGANSQSWNLPKTGMLARLYLKIRGSVAGTLSAPNALGMASIISRVRLTANSGIDLVNISGAGYHYLLRDLIESEYIDPVSQSTARDAVTATTFNLDMVLPIAVNLRDPIGLIMLQNEATLVTLTVDFENDTAVATGATVTCTVTPYLEVFTVPVDPQDWPALDVVHQILEDKQAVSAAGEFTYNWPRGNTYLQMMHGLGIGATGADGWSQYAARVNQSDYLMNVDKDFVDLQFRFLRGRARELGVIPVDLLASSGLGNYGLTRDVFNSALVTDLASIVTATGAGTLYTVRRQLVVLR